MAFPPAEFAAAASSHSPKLARPILSWPSSRSTSGSGIRARLPRLRRQLRETLPLFIPVLLWLLLFSCGVALIPDTFKPPINVTILPAIDRRLFRSSVHWFSPETGTPLHDLLAAVPYTIHPILPLVFILTYFLLSPRDNRRHLLTFVLAFGIMNLFAVLTHLAFPTAPPWYFLQHGTTPASYEMKGDPAILARLDKRYGMDMYHRMYAEGGKVVFGAWPSLHAAWPYLMARFRPAIPYRGVQVFQWCYMVLVWWAAIYLQHHYAADILGGVIYAEIAYQVAKMANVADREKREGGFKRLPRDELVLPFVVKE